MLTVRAVVLVLETLPAFLNKVVNDYQHDYGTICEAVAVAAMPTNPRRVIAGAPDTAPRLLDESSIMGSDHI